MKVITSVEITVTYALPGGDSETEKELFSNEEGNLWNFINYGEYVIKEILG